MNIYITKQNEEFLKGLPTEQSMSGLINELLNDVRAAASTLPEKRIKEIFTPPKIPGVVKGSDFVSKDTCPHGFAKGNCKKDDCNKKYRR